MIGMINRFNLKIKNRLTADRHVMYFWPLIPKGSFDCWCHLLFLLLDYTLILYLVSLTADSGPKFAPSFPLIIHFSLVEIRSVSISMIVCQWSPQSGTLILLIMHIFNTNWCSFTNYMFMFQIIKNDELQEPSSETFVTVYLGKLRGSNVAIKRNGRCFSRKSSQQDQMHVNALLSGLH